MTEHKMKRHTKIVLASVGALTLVGGLVVAAGHGMASGWKNHGGGHGEHRMEMFEKIDANGDGKVTRAEIDAYRADLVARYDADNDKAISLSEFEGLLLEQMRPMVVDKFQMLDDDGDGKITVSEVDTKLNRMMRRLDDDGDGAVEFREMRGHHDEHGYGRHQDDDDDKDDDDRS